MVTKPWRPQVSALPLKVGKGEAWEKLRAEGGAQVHVRKVLIALSLTPSFVSLPSPSGRCRRPRSRTGGSKAETASVDRAILSRTGLEFLRLARVNNKMHLFAGGSKRMASNSANVPKYNHVSFVFSFMSFFSFFKSPFSSFCKSLRMGVYFVPHAFSCRSNFTIPPKLS